MKSDDKRKGNIIALQIKISRRFTTLSINEEQNLRLKESSQNKAEKIRSQTIKFKMVYLAPRRIYIS